VLPQEKVAEDQQKELGSTVGRGKSNEVVEYQRTLGPIL